MISGTPSGSDMTPSSIDIPARLFEQAGPILKYRVARDLLELPTAELDRCYRDMRESPQVQRWLALLGRSENVHGSRDTDAENALAKLLEYGLDRGDPDFDRGVRRILDRPLKKWDALVLLPLLVRAGYGDREPVRGWFQERLGKLTATARRGEYDFYLSPQEARKVPTAWHGKLIYRDEYGDASGYALPTCFDLYALGYAPDSIAREEGEQILAFLGDPRFQSTPGGYGWDHASRRCYTAGRVFLACVEPCRLLLFMELAAPFKAARGSEWFMQGLKRLEEHHTGNGSIRFPPDLLIEAHNHYLYAGAHMGLGENRRNPPVLELESTFRYRLILQRTGVKNIW